jgi:exodeoxyribonuclease VII large subunit
MYPRLRGGDTEWEVREVRDLTPPPIQRTSHPMPVPLSNSVEFTVSELADAVKKTVEGQFDFVRVRGEISGFRGRHSSGHAYFTLKDSDATIDAVIWKLTFPRLIFKPEEGLEVIATGRLTTFPKSSKYQLIIDQLEPAGAGALMALLEERRKKFLAEGLFAQERKRPLPYLPRVIGVITSPTGAVIRDILHRLDDRFPSHVVVWPVRVQGDTCAAEVAAAIAGFNRIQPGGRIPRPDVLIVARGGGSIEDLWGYNEEIVVRAAAASLIPLISAVGHETDTTLLDYVADLRAPTPTAAAEQAVPVRSELVAYVDDMGSRGRQAVRRTGANLRDRWRAAAAGMPKPENLLSTAHQRLDLASTRLRSSLQASQQKKTMTFATVAPRISRTTLIKFLDQEQRHCAQIAGRLVPAVERLLARHGERLAERTKLMDAVSYKAVLARGFALVTDDEDNLVRTPADVRPGSALTISLANEAAIGATVSGAPAIRRKPRVKRSTPDGQQSLF